MRDLTETTRAVLLAVVESATDIDAAEVAEMEPAQIIRVLAVYAPEAVETLIRTVAWIVEGASLLDCSPARIVTLPPADWTPTPYWLSQAAETVAAQRVTL